ncbi:transglutaminase-like domain-containing protein [Roseomonas elaeocarpi]|uniref:Transglutaminase family protein n=1 Tax=Roseomonas elaeocarpi TaxID=907779 RepID=A0ABV6JY75_9PROT
MDRRALLLTPALLGLASTGAGAADAPPPNGQAAAPGKADGTGWRRFEVTTRVTLTDPEGTHTGGTNTGGTHTGGAAQLWLPLVQTAGGYQLRQALRCEAGGQAAVVRDAQYGAEVLRVEWAADSPAPRTAEVVQTVATRDRTGGEAALPLTAAERRFWLQPTESVPVDGIVRDTAERIVAGRTAPRDRLRAIYDWVVDNTSRNPDTPGCGLGDVRAMLESGNLSGKCADINGLMTGLARAAGLPARDVYGIRVAASRQFRTLGASGDVSKAQHCRSEVFLEDTGWFPIDPADVRKVVLEHKLALDSEPVSALREQLFGNWEMNWVGYNSATDIELPGSLAGQRPNFAFLMYPCAFTAAGQPDCLDPAHFQYAITAREIAA